MGFLQGRDSAREAYRAGITSRFRDDRTGLTPTFSLCQSTARLPDGWRKAAQTWLDSCDNPGDVEHIIATDEPLDVEHFTEIFPNTVLTLNRGRRCAVDGWNASARVARGKFLITVADDWYPCPHWDSEILKALPSKDGITDLDGEWVLDVNTGGNDNLLTFSMLTRAYFDRLTRDYDYQGGFFYREYLGMFADNEFTDLARRDKVIINARNLYFEHVHPLYGKGEMDEVHQWQHRPEAFEVGGRVYQRRRIELGFPGLRRPLICCALPGERFDYEWMQAWTSLYGRLMVDYNVIPCFGYCSNVYVMRSAIHDMIMHAPEKPDLVLWIDDDNPVGPEHVEMLLRDLNEHPEADAVAGWCWIKGHRTQNSWRTSVGFFDQNGAAEPWSYMTLMQGTQNVKEVDFSGFPVMLMRLSALVKAGERPFAPEILSNHPWGFSGEDTAFCKRAKAGGARIFVDRRVRVRHLKLDAAEPHDAPCLATPR